MKGPALQQGPGSEVQTIDLGRQTQRIIVFNWTEEMALEGRVLCCLVGFWFRHVGAEKFNRS